MKNSRIVYYDSYSILVINPSGEMRRLYTPFLVKCINSIGNIQVNSCLYVNEVIKDQENNMRYKIGNNIYPYSDFKIYSKF